MDNSIARFRNLTHWSQDDWKDLDIHLFIAANFNRYCSTLIKKIGLQYLPSDTTESLLGLFCDVAFKPLTSVHKKNLTAQGERRNQIMLGTLKMIASTRMVEALIKEYPSYIALEQLPEYTDQDCNQQDGLYLGGGFEPVTMNSYQNTLFAAETADIFQEETDREEELENDRISVMVEMLRSYLTPVQYLHIRYAVCDGLNSHEIAERTGHSVTNVRIMLLNARKKMMDLVPSHLLTSIQDCLHRK